REIAGDQPHNGRSGDVDDERMIRKGCSEEAWANDVNDVPQRRAKTAADKNQDIVHLSFFRLFRHGRARPGHPRLSYLAAARTWMPGTMPGMTSFSVRFCRKLAIPARIRKRRSKRKGGSSMLPPQDSLPSIRPSRTAGRHTPSSPDDRQTPSDNPDGDCDSRCNRS